MTSNLMTEEKPTSRLFVTPCTVLAYAVELADGRTMVAAEKQPTQAFAVVHETESDTTLIAMYSHQESAVARCQDIVAGFAANRETIQ